MNPIPVIIPARGGSKGIPGKNVRPVAGKPLIAHTIAAALDCPEVSGVWVSTDDGEIAAVARSFGARVIERPAELASDTATSESALLHALEALEAAGVDCEAFAFVQCTSPLLTSEDLTRGIRHFRESEADTLLSVTPNHRFLWRAGENGYEGINHDASVRLRRQDLPAEYAENGAFYLMRTAGFRAARHRFFGKIEVSVMDSRSAMEIDDEADLELVDLLLRQRAARPAGRSLGDLKAIVFDFDGVFTDDRVWVDENGRESAVCSRADGMGIERLRNAFPGSLLILSRETNPIVKHRARKLRLECIHGEKDKLTVLRDWARDHGLSLAEIAYLGNDINDAACLEAVGLAIVPADAHPAVRPLAHWTLSACGGKGAVREFCDRMLSDLSPANPS